VAMTGRIRLLIHYALPCGMRLRSFANFVDSLVILWKQNGITFLYKNIFPAGNCFNRLA